MTVKQENLDALLLNAAEVGDVSGLVSAINAGANPNAQDATGLTPLMWATMLDSKKILALLLNAGADKNMKDMNDSLTALMFAAYNSRTNALEKLLDAGAALDLQSKLGWTALICAAMNGHVECIQPLLNAGADLYLKNKKGETALDILLERNFLDAALIIQSAIVKQHQAVLTRETKLPSFSLDSQKQKL